MFGRTAAGKSEYRTEPFPKQRPPSVKEKLCEFSFKQELVYIEICRKRLPKSIIRIVFMLQYVFRILLTMQSVNLIPKQFKMMGKDIFGKGCD